MSHVQELKYHDDTTPRHKLTNDEIAFLKSLQTELNTQDPVSTADPRYWGIVTEESVPTSEEYGDEICLVDTADGITYAEGIDNIRGEIRSHCPTAWSVWCEQEQVCPNEADVMDIQEFLEWMNSDENNTDECPDSLAIVPVRHISSVAPNLFFLTHRDAAEYLDQYGYNHQPKDRPYCMRAVRSPRYQTLIDIIRCVDWDDIAKHICP